MDHPDSGKSPGHKQSETTSGKQSTLHRFYAVATRATRPDTTLTNAPVVTTAVAPANVIDVTPKPTIPPPQQTPAPIPYIYTHELENALTTCAKAAQKGHEVIGRCLTDTGKTIMRAALQSYRETANNPDSTQEQVDAAEFDMSVLYTSVRHHTKALEQRPTTPQCTTTDTAPTILNHHNLDIPARFIQLWIVEISAEPHLPYHPSLSHLTVVAQMMYAQFHFGNDPVKKAEALDTMKGLIPSDRGTLAHEFDQRVKELEAQVHAADVARSKANLARAKLDAEKHLAMEKLDEAKRIAKTKLDEERLIASRRAAQDRSFTDLRKRHHKRPRSHRPSIPDDQQSISSHTSATGSIASVERAFRDIWKIADDPAQGVILTVYVALMREVSPEKSREASHQYLTAVVSSANSALHLSSKDAVVAPCYAFTTSSPGNRRWALGSDNRLHSRPIAATGGPPTSGDMPILRTDPTNARAATATKQARSPSAGGSLTSGDMPILSTDSSEARAAAATKQARSSPSTGGDSHMQQIANDDTDLDNISISIRDQRANTASVSITSDDRAHAWQRFYLGMAGLTQPARTRGAPAPTIVLPTIGNFSRFNHHESKALDIAIAQLHDTTAAYNETLQELDLLRVAGHPPPKESCSIHEMTATGAVAVHLQRLKRQYDARVESVRHITDLVNKGVADANLTDTFHGGMRTSKAPVVAIPLTGSVPAPTVSASEASLQPTVPPGAYVARSLCLNKEKVFTELVRHLPRAATNSMLVSWAVYCSTHDADINDPDTELGQRWRTEYASAVTNPRSEPPWNPFIDAGPRALRGDPVRLPQPQSRPTVSPQAMWHIRHAEPREAYMELMTTLDAEHNAIAYAWIDADYKTYCSKVPKTEDQEARHHAIAFCIDYANRCGDEHPPYPWLSGVQTPTNYAERPNPRALTTSRGAQWMAAAIASHDRHCESQSDTSSDSTPARGVLTRPTGNHPDEADDDIAYDAACLAHAKAQDRTCRRNDGTFHAKVGEPLRDNKKTNRSGTAPSRARITGPSVLLPNGARKARAKPTAPRPATSTSVNMFATTTPTIPSRNYATHTRNIRKLDAEATALGTVLTPAAQWSRNPYQPYAAERHDNPWFDGQLRCSNCWGCHASGGYQPWFVCDTQWSAHHQRMAELIYANRPSAGSNSPTRNSNQIILEIVSYIDSVLPSFIDDLATVNDLIAQHPERNTGMVRQLANSLRGVHRILATVGPPPPQHSASSAGTPPTHTAADAFASMGEDDLVPQGDQHTIHAHVRAHARQRAPVTQHRQPLHPALQRVLDRDTAAAGKPESRSPRRRAAKDLQDEMDDLADKWIAVKCEHDASTSNLAADTRRHDTPSRTPLPVTTAATPSARVFTTELGDDDANDDDGYATGADGDTSIHIHLHAPLNSTDAPVALLSLPPGPGLHVLMHPDVVEDTVLLHTQLAELGCAPNVTVVFEDHAHLDDNVAIMAAAARTDATAPADQPDSPATTALLAHAAAMPSSPGIATMQLRSLTAITPDKLQEAFACSQAYTADLAATTSPGPPTTSAAAPPQPGPTALDIANMTTAAAAYRQAPSRPRVVPYQTLTRQAKSGPPKDP